MKVLAACEMSGIVRDAFIEAGHDAISCDLMPSERPGPHIVGDVLALDLSVYDLVVAFPPCTTLTVSGNGTYGKGKPKEAERESGLALVRFFLDAPCERVAVENPIGVISSRIRKPDQIIQPYLFGHRESKATCLWLRGLPKLTPTCVVDPQWYGCCGGRFAYSALGKGGCPVCHGAKNARPIYDNQTASGQNRLAPSHTRAQERARTYPGIARAMASQWPAAAREEV